MKKYTNGVTEAANTKRKQFISCTGRKTGHEYGAGT